MFASDMYKFKPYAILRVTSMCSPPVYLACGSAAGLTQYSTASLRPKINPSLMNAVVNRRLEHAQRGFDAASLASRNLGPVTTAMRCNVCLNLQYEDSEPRTQSSYIPFNVLYHDTVGGVRRAASQGCHFCTMILAGLSFHGSQPREVTIPDGLIISLGLFAKRRYSEEERT